MNGVPDMTVHAAVSTCPGLTRLSTAACVFPSHLPLIPAHIARDSPRMLGDIWPVPESYRDQGNEDF